MLAYKKVYRDYSFYKMPQKRRKRQQVSVRISSVHPDENQHKRGNESERQCPKSQPDGDPHRPEPDRISVEEESWLILHEREPQTHGLGKATISLRHAHTDMGTIPGRAQGKSVSEVRSQEPTTKDFLTVRASTGKYSEELTDTVHPSSLSRGRSNLPNGTENMSGVTRAQNARDESSGRISAIAFPPKNGAKTDIETGRVSAEVKAMSVTEAKPFPRPKLRKKSPRKLHDSSGSAPRESVLPEHCRNIFALRRLMDEKAGQLMTTWTPQYRRQQEVQRILARVSLPKLVSRSESTSAIFREYRELKERGGRKYNPNFPEASGEVTLEISQVLQAPPMSGAEKVSNLQRSAVPKMAAIRSTTVV